MYKMGFPTLGEVVKYLFDRSGLLSPVVQSNTGLETSKEVKSFQKVLERLAKEDSKLDENLNNALLKFVYCLNDVGFDQKVIQAITSTLNDCFIQYKMLIQNEGSHFNKSQTIRWIVKTLLIDRLCLSQQKYTYMLNIVDFIDTLPQREFWYLPAFDDEDNIEWPISIALNWAYDIAETSRTRFHVPDKSPTDHDYRLEQNLENAGKWISGEKNRSWQHIKENLLASFDAMANSNNNAYKRNFSNKARTTILHTTFITRFTIEICQSIMDEYGKEFLIDCCNQYKKRIHELKFDNELIEYIGNMTIARNGINDIKELDTLWFTITDQHWKNRANQVPVISQKIQPYISGCQSKKAFATTIPEDIRIDWLKEFGPYTLNSILEGFVNRTSLSQEFIETFYQLKELRKYPSDTEDAIIALSEIIESKEALKSLWWAYYWCRACYHYRKKDFKNAHPFYQKAFNHGKYVAGHEQYLLTNQYIEVCAKMKKWVEFKKAVAWAKYINIDVRFLRDKSESEENLRFAYKMFSQGIYATL